MKIEWWRFIPGFDCKYMVSDYGNVVSLNYHRTGKIKKLKQHLDHNGYLFVSLSNGRHKSLKTHRLVAITFIPNPHNYPQVNHKNEDKTDNRVENLEWCDSSYNINYGDRNSKISKMVNQYSIKGELIKQYPSISEATRQTGIQHSAICSCCLQKPKFKTAGGFKWSYA